MADQTPHQTGTASAVEATPGAVIAAALVLILRGTKYALDGDQAMIVVGALSIVSSYVLGIVRGLRAGKP